MDVAAALDVQRPNQRKSLISKALVVSVAKGLKRCDDRGFARVNAHRVDVFHGTDDGGVIGFVPHHFVFEFLPAQNGLFNQHLGNAGIAKTELGDFNEFAHVPSRSTTQTAQGKGWANQDGPTADEFGGCNDLVDGIAGHGLADGEVDGFADFVEQFTVLCLVNSVQIRTDEFHAKPFKRTVVR